MHHSGTDYNTLLSVTGSSGELISWLSIQSYAESLILTGTLAGKLLMNIMNKIGARTLPRGTPDMTSFFGLFRILQTLID